MTTMPAQASTGSVSAGSVSAGSALPDAPGRFGRFGGRHAPEALMAALDELTAAFESAKTDPEFLAEHERLRRDYIGRPTLLTELPRFAEHVGCRVFAKREDLAHTGSHKINNVIGQALLTKRMGKTRMIAETGRGPARRRRGDRGGPFGLECVVYMGAEDTRRQALNVARMRMLGTEGRSGHDRQPDAQGRDQRGVSRLGGHRRQHALLHRLGDGPAPVPDHGP